MLLLIKGKGGSSMALMVSKTRACRSFRSETCVAAPKTARRLTSRLHRIWITTDKGGATRTPKQTKSVCHGQEHDQGQNGINPPASEKAWFDPYFQGD